MVRFSRFFTLLSAATFSLAAWGQTPDYVEMMQDHSINFYDVVDAFNSHWEGQSVEKGRGWKQFKRWEHSWSHACTPVAPAQSPNHCTKATSLELKEPPRLRSGV